MLIEANGEAKSAWRTSGDGRDRRREPKREQYTEAALKELQ
jgi:hypothetical protein